MGKEQEYYKAVRRAVTAVNSPSALKNRLDAVVRNIARSMNTGVSLMLLDSTGSKLVHTSTRGLPPFYRRKGVLDATKSGSEVITGQPVIITDTSTDRRVQYPEMAEKAGIASVLGIPILSGQRPIGTIRIYARERRDFSAQDIAFVTTMANLASVIVSGESGRKPDSGVKLPGPEISVLKRVRSVTFAHPSEEEFARILDFYNIEWVYEPHSFPLKWDGDTVTEMFTPDFYLPGLDMYIELTTARQKLITQKNHKLRLLKELHPEIKVTLLYKKDYDSLLAKYGCGPLAQTRARGIEKVLYSSSEISDRVRVIAEQISADYAGRRPLLVGVQRGFICFMADLIRQISIPVDIDFLAISYYKGENNSAVRITKDIDLNITGRDVLMVEGIVDTGITLGYILKHLLLGKPASLGVCTLLNRRARRLADIKLDYIGFEVPDKFVVGYGLDYREEYRNLPFIGIAQIEKKYPSE